MDSHASYLKHHPRARAHQFVCNMFTPHDIRKVRGRGGSRNSGRGSKIKFMKGEGTGGGVPPPWRRFFSFPFIWHES